MIRQEASARSRVVLGQPEQQRGRPTLAIREDDGLRERLAEDLDGSFEELVRTYQDRLFSFALRLTGRREDAEEAAQDAFVRAYRALAGYPPGRIREMALRAWLYQITLNVVRNRVRGKRLRLVSLDHPLSPRGETAWEAPDAEDARPDAVYERGRRRRDMEALVAGLPERYRAPILLRYVEGLRLEEVARVLGQPLGTAKSNVHRGVNALREALVASRRKG
ncbi:MAG TPA: sigma-70 family RNA polymerase sigma factor [Thermoanaerobaculia bacterium]|nr:sigma-70 family RNA polymerase sigma factor [Thermoanaerobaculia bacterium]